MRSGSYSVLEPYVVSAEEVTVETAIATVADVYNNYLPHDASSSADNMKHAYVVIVKDPDTSVENAGVAIITQNSIALWSTNSQTIYTRYESGTLRVRSHPASYTGTALFVVPAGARMIVAKIRVAD